MNKLEKIQYLRANYIELYLPLRDMFVTLFTRYADTKCVCGRSFSEHSFNDCEYFDAILDDEVIRVLERYLL